MHSQLIASISFTQSHPLMLHWGGNLVIFPEKVEFIFFSRSNQTLQLLSIDFYRGCNATKEMHV